MTFSIVDDMVTPIDRFRFRFVSFSFRFVSVFVSFLFSFSLQAVLAFKLADPSAF